MIFACILICILFLLMMIEAVLTRSAIERIRLKIHVNGTRGKSTITKYISAALRSSVISTIGKVTGEIPALIRPDGTTTPIRRIGAARINEQFRTIRKASKEKAEALVLECMSIDPALQIAESKYFNPDIYIISNIKDDHREKIGQTREQRVESVCQAIPANCILVSNDYENLDSIRAEAHKKKCRLVIPDKLPDRKLPEGVFQANVELAAEVAVLAGVDREQAIEAILESLTKEEPLTIQLPSCKNNIVFLNGFSVNDPGSASDFLDHWTNRLGIMENIMMIFNTRADRPLRTDMFSEWIMERTGQIRCVCITGDQKGRAFSKLRSLRPVVEIRKLGSNRIKGLINTVENDFNEVKLIVGIGNIKRDGYKVINELKIRARSGMESSIL
jgi:poly-gamma-glutamate synthase PgsB/CapB